MKVKSSRSYTDLSKTLLMLGILLCSVLSAIGQKERSLLREGNQAYDEEDFEKAATKYEEALEQNGSYGKANFNLGNALYRQGNLGEASKNYEKAAADAIEKEDKARAYHNVGNSFLNAARMLMQNPPQANDSVQPPDPQQLIKASIEAYKRALRNVPTDEETRYNLAYAQKLLDKNGGGGGEDQQDQQDKGDQEEEQEQQEQDKGDEGDEEQEQQQNDQGDEGEEEQQEQQPRPNEMTKEEAEQLLKALDNNEKDLQEKMAKDRMQGERIKIEKDW
jgi:Ca-activated chloride channel family protein